MKDHASPEVYFAQHLASNDTKIRNRAVKKLRAWLTFRSTAGAAFTQENMLRIWKGLYYCMWMCDKPLNQEHLADSISDLVHCFAKPQPCMLFIDTFFQSMSKEWHGIDRYRIEKFLLLVRRFLCQCFCLLSKHQWKPKLIAKLLKVLKKHVLNPEVTDTPSGLKMHIMDIYLDELAKAGGCDLKPKRFTKFIRPYIIYLTECHDNVQLGTVVKEIFHPLIWQAFHEDEDEDSDDEETVTFQVDFNYIADLLLKRVTQKEDLKGGNRNRIYKLIAELRSAAEGEFPFAKVDSDDDHEDFALKKSDINRAVRALVESDLKLKEEKRKRIQEMRQKQKRKHHSEESESEGETFQEELMSKIKFTESDRLTNKPKGKKHKKGKSKTKKGMKASGKKSVKKVKAKKN